MDPGGTLHSPRRAALPQPPCCPAHAALYRSRIGSRTPRCQPDFQAAPRSQRASGRPRRHSVASAAAALVARRPICTWWAMHAPAAHRPRGAGSSFVMNSRATRRAGELAAADPAHRAWLGRRLQLDARSRMEKLPRGAPFGFELETTIDHGVLGGREAVRCAVRRLCDAPSAPLCVPLWGAPHRARHSHTQPIRLPKYLAKCLTTSNNCQTTAR